MSDCNLLVSPNVYEQFVKLSVSFKTLQIRNPYSVLRYFSSVLRYFSKQLVSLAFQVPTQYSNFGSVIRNIQNKLVNRTLKSDLKSIVDIVEYTSDIITVGSKQNILTFFQSIYLDCAARYSSVYLIICACVYSLRNAWSLLTLFRNSFFLKAMSMIFSCSNVDQISFFI